MLILGIETSCDETSVALVRVEQQRIEIVEHLIASQIEFHKPYGGVVPEVATRKHLETLQSMVEQTLEKSGMKLRDIEGIGVTRGPGLASSLMIGLSFAKGLAMIAGCPWIGVNHLEGHIFSPFIQEKTLPQDPHIALVVSGGHTLLLNISIPFACRRLGTTLDDAAGEAFDKVSKLLGLGYPGGPAIEKYALQGDPSAIDFPRSMLHSDDLNFSFSGLKTAVRVFLQQQTEYSKEDVCASFQQAVVDVLVEKTRKACQQQQVDFITLSGGVSCNQRLRTAMESMATEEGWTFKTCAPQFSTDNAAMIAVVAGARLIAGEKSSWNTDIDPKLALAGS